jgi:integrase
MAHLRIYIAGKSRFEAIPNTFFKSEHWDKKNKRVKNRTPDCQNINEYITFYLLKAQQILRRYDMENRNITFDSFKKELFYNGYDTDFFEYAQKYINKYDNKSTSDKYVDSISKLKQFVRSEKLSFGEIDENLLVKFKEWCMREKNNREITANKGLGQIRAIFNAAINDKIITDNPVKKITLRDFEGKKNALTSEAVKYLLQYLKTEKLKPRTHSRLSAFLFACCCGLRWSDIQKMKFEDLQGNILEVTEKKTKKYRKLTIIKGALSLIDFSKKTSDRQPIFSLLPNTSSPVNEMLKEIANIINDKEGREIVGKKITVMIDGVETVSNTISFHSSRATFITSIENYTDIFTAAKIAGNTPKVASNNYAARNTEKENRTLDLIDNEFFS